VTRNPAAGKTLTFTSLGSSLTHDLISLCCLALSAEEVAIAVKMMFDTLLTDRDSKVPAPFSSNNPPPDVIHCLASNHNVFDDIVFPFDEPRGPFLKSSWMSFCPTTMMMTLPFCQSMMLRPIERCQLPMMLKVQE
jgi:hypothetical protein